MMSRHLLRIFAIAWWCLAAVGTAAAGPADQVEEQLRATDEALQRAREIVRESSSDRARTLLERAIPVQEAAWNQFRNDRLLVALRLTEEAREIGSRALTLARQDQALEQRARREGERAERALLRAKELLGGPAPPAVERLLAQAASLLERGRVQYQEQHFEAALRLAVSAQRLIRQATGLVGGDHAEPRVVRELERTDNLIERVEPIVRERGGNEALAALERGLDLQAKAWSAHAEQQYRVALAQTREARNLVNRARTMVTGPLDRDAVDESLAATQAQIDRAADLVRESGRAIALSLLERAQDHQLRAKRLVEQQQYRQALAETRVARALAQRATRLAEEEGGAR